MSSAKDESSISGTVSISVSIGNSRVSLVGSLKDRSNAGGLLSTPRKCFIVWSPLTLSLNAFCARNSPVCLIKETHISPLQYSKTVVSFLGSVVSLKRLRLIRSGSSFASNCLYDAAALSRFTFCLSCKVDVAYLSAEPGAVNVVSSTLQRFPIYSVSFYPLSFFK